MGCQNPGDVRVQTITFIIVEKYRVALSGLGDSLWLLPGPRFASAQAIKLRAFQPFRTNPLSHAKRHPTLERLVFSSEFAIAS